MVEGEFPEVEMNKWHRVPKFDMSSDDVEDDAETLKNKKNPLDY